MKNKLIAHRGDMTSYPENSMLAIQAAADFGFSYIEIDIQLSKDAKAIVIHDDNLIRTTGINKNVRELTAEKMQTYSVNFQGKSKEDPGLLHIPTLEEVVNRLNNYSDATLFVEIKRQSIEHFDLLTVVDSVLLDLKQAKFNTVIISFVEDVITYLQLQDEYPVGWVIRQYNQTQFEEAKKIQPDYLFCNVKKVNQPTELWQGPWKWVLYDIKNPVFAYELLKQGVSLIETGDIVKLCHSEEFI